MQLLGQSVRDLVFPTYSTFLPTRFQALSGSFMIQNDFMENLFEFSVAVVFIYGILLRFNYSYRVLCLTAATNTNLLSVEVGTMLHARGSILHRMPSQHWIRSAISYSVQ